MASELNLPEGMAVNMRTITMRYGTINALVMPDMDELQEMTAVKLKEIAPEYMDRRDRRDPREMAALIQHLFVINVHALDAVRNKSRYLLDTRQSNSVSKEIHDLMVRICNVHDSGRSIPRFWKLPQDYDSANRWIIRTNSIMFRLSQIRADIHDIVSCVQPQRPGAQIFITTNQFNQYAH